MQDIVPKKRKAVFLDRDGVINEEVNYAHRRDQLTLVPRTADAIRLLNDNGFLVVVVSNQAGIGRGLYEECDMHAFNSTMEQALEKESNAHVDAIYWCAHHPEAVRGAYRIACNCRKPNPGMILRASEELSVNLSRSFMVGDKWSDIDAGRRATCTTVIVRTGHGEQELADEKKRKANYIAADLYDAVHFILNEDNRREV